MDLYLLNLDNPTKRKLLLSKDINGTSESIFRYAANDNKLIFNWQMFYLVVQGPKY